MQLYPPLILGLYWPRFSGRATLADLGVGVLTVGGLTLGGVGHIWVFDSGLCGLGLNCAIGVATALLWPDSAVGRPRTWERFFALFAQPSLQRSEASPTVRQQA